MFGIFKKKQIRSEIQRIIDSIDYSRWEYETYYNRYPSIEEFRNSKLCRLRNKKNDIVIHLNVFKLSLLLIKNTQIRLMKDEKLAINRKINDFIKGIEKQEKMQKKVEILQGQEIERMALSKINEMEL